MPGTLVSQSLLEKLSKAFPDSFVELLNVSDQHRGHAGVDPLNSSGETHFNLLIVSALFSGKRRVDRHRMVNEALKSELGSRVHALSIRAQTPDEHDEKV